MQPLKYLLMLLGVGLFGSAGALVAYDILLAEQLRQLLQRQAKVHASARALVYRIGFAGCRAGHGLR
jgi:hypothetical protein